MIIVILKSLVWIISITAIIHITVGYALWRLLGLSFNKKLIICLISLTGLFLPDIVFPMTLQIFLPETPKVLGLALSYFIVGFPFIFIPGLLLSSHFETSDFLSSCSLASPFHRFWKIYFIKFLQLMVPFSLIMFLWMFHNFSLPAHWEIELLPNYLFAEFNTYYSFTPFFKKIFIIAPILILISVLYYKLLSSSRTQHFSLENFDKKSSYFFPGIAIFSLWFLSSVIFPAVYWTTYLLDKWKSVDWLKVADCWEFTIQVSLGVSLISLIAGIIAFSFKKLNIAISVIILCAVYSLGNIAVAVSGIFLFGNFKFLSGLRESIVPMLFSLCVIYVPLTVSLLLFLKSKVNKNIYYAAQLFISNKTKRLKYISIPILLPGIVTIMLIILNFTGKDLDTSILMVPPGKSFLPVRLNLLLHYADFPSLAAIVLIYIFVIILTVLLIYTLAKTLIKYGTFKS
ncbi:MAG: hypothetical protein DRI44_04125 [Chlamydiae bacterium]|nr:MAG: hypothetical protein DRI44_04125 [Chlamydiota bacterium]